MSDADSPDWYPATPSTQPSSETDRGYEKELSNRHENFEADTIATPDSQHARASFTVSERISSHDVPSESQGSIDLFGSYEMTFSKSAAAESQASSTESVLSVKTLNIPLIADQTPPIFNPNEGFSWEPVTNLSWETCRRLIRPHGDVKIPSSYESDQSSISSQPDKKPSLEINQVGRHEVLAHSVTGNSAGVGCLQLLETDEEAGGIEDECEIPEDDSELFHPRGGTDSTQCSSPESSHSWLGIERDLQDSGSDGSLSPLLPDRETYLAEERELEPRMEKIQQQYEDYLLARRISRGLDPFTKKSLRSRSSQDPNSDSSSCSY